MKYKVNFDIDLKKNPYPGLYIALEGIDGSGKTTQAALLSEHFKKEGREVLNTREPRQDTVVGKLVHQILEAKVKVPPVSLQYLFAADRAIHQEQVVIPALKKGTIVISDRNFWSAIPYGLLDKSEAEKDENPDQLLTALSILSFYHEFITPDKTFILDVSVETSEKRLAETHKLASIYETRAKLAKLKKGYEFLEEHFAEELARVDAEKSPEAVVKEILDVIKKLQK